MVLLSLEWPNSWALPSSGSHFGSLNTGNRKQEQTALCSTSWVPGALLQTRFSAAACEVGDQHPGYK